MPKAIASWAATAATNAGASALVSSLVYWGTFVGVTVGISYAGAAIARSGIAKPEAYAQPLKQPIAPRVTAYGRNRLSGPYMLWEAKGGQAFDVVAFHDGRIGGIDAVMFNDDVVTITAGEVTASNAGDSRYGVGATPKRVKVYSRLGLATETSYTTDFDFSALGAGVWTENHRGDGIASVFVGQKSVEQANMSTAYPNGPVAVSVVGDMKVIHDWRDEGEDPEDDATWTASYNPIVQLADYLTSGVHGMGFDWATRVAPNIEEWTEEADLCDEAVAKNSGTEPRYECHGPFSRQTDHADVIGQLLQSMDGWLSQKSDGTFSPRCGVFREPAVTFTDDHVIEYDVDRFTVDEDRVEGLRVSYTSPVHDYREVETSSWGDGDSDRIVSLSLPWVQSNSQARRLAKRSFLRLTADVRGGIVTNLYGLRGLGERYIRLQLSELPSLNDALVEIVKATINVEEMTVAFRFILADEDMDDWDPGTEEGFGPGTDGTVLPDGLAAPVISDVTPQFEALGTGGTGVRLLIECSSPSRDDLTWLARWRVDGADGWTEQTVVDGDAVASTATLLTGFVTAEATVEYQVAFTIGGGDTSPWSIAATVNTSTDTVAPDAPTDLAGEVDAGPPEQAIVSWRNPTSPNFDHARLFRNSTNTLTGATDLGEIAGGIGAVIIQPDSPGAGTWYYWVRAENASDTASAEIGSISVTLA